MKKWILLPLLLVMTHSALSQNYLPKTTSYTTKDGLSSNEIHAIHKDSRGFLWMGTQNGLDRFDGHSFVHFSKSSHPQMTLDRVQYIAEDNSGYLWLVERNENFEYSYASPEINLFNIHSNKWITLEERFGEKIPFQAKEISFIEQQPDGSIFFYCHFHGKGYLFRKDTFTAFPLPKILRMSDFAIDKKGLFLMEGTFNNKDRYVFLVNEQGEIVHQRSANLSLTVQTADGSNQVLDFSGTDFLLGTNNLDAYQFLNPDLIKESTVPTSKGIKIDQAVWNEDQALLWLKSSMEVLVITANGDLVFREEGAFDYYDLPFYFDGNTTWHGSKQNGLQKVVLQANYFQNYQLDVEGFSNSTRGIFTDGKGSLWISTINGMLHNNTPDKKLAWLSKNRIYTNFLKDKSNQLWFFQATGLAKYDLSTGQKETVPYQWETSANTWSLYEADDGNLWTFGHYGYHYIVDPTNGKVLTSQQLPFLEKSTFHVYFIQKRNAQSVWLCTNKGLYILDSQGNYIAHYNQSQEGRYYLPATSFHHLYQDQDGSVWLASGDNGLLEINDQGESLKLINHYTTENGLSCNILHAIYEDDFHYLWISSNEGLMQWDKTNQEVTKYFTEHGLPHNEFNRIAHFQDKNGRLYFGGLMGMTSFHPKDFAKTRSRNNPSPLAILSFQQFSGEAEKFVDLTHQLLQSNTVTLQPTDQFFSLEVALLNYEEEQQNTYQFRINGLYDWQSTSRGKLSISGLPYGQQTLEVRAFNGSQQAAANQLAISIHVLRPFYLQWWFLLLSIAGVIGGIWYWVKRRTRRLLQRQETEQLKALDQMKSHFFANIAHELRTPLTLISLPLEHLMKNLDRSSKTEIMQYLQSAYRNKEDLNRLISEILDLSKLQSNNLIINTQAFTLSTFLARAVYVFHTSATSKGIQFQFSSLITEKTMVKADQGKLEMVINNLMSNALKFTEENGTITIHADWNEEEGLVFKVQDTGRGIRPEDLPHVFERYFQSKQKDRALEGGSGIGLAICKELIELMGGTIQVRSEWQQGSTFEFKLPLELTEVAEEIQPVANDNGVILMPTPEMESSPFLEEKPTILVAEDNPELRHHLQNILQPNYNVCLAANGKEALKQLETRTCHLIISDVMMPTMDGFTFVKKVKNENRWCSIPFILLTARTNINDKLHGLRIGVDAYMYKPFEVDELRLRVKNLLANVKNRKEELAEVAQTYVATAASSTKKIATTTAPQNPDFVGNKELEWLKQVEIIAKREIKNSGFSIDDLALELHTSRRQVFRRIKKITGLTPRKYLNTIRLHNARTILETEKVYTLTEISYAVGFENPSYFANLFEAEFGKRPHDFLIKSAN